MSSDQITCLFCQTQNDADQQTCKKCGMALSKDTPNSTNVRRNRFKKWYWFIFIFCIIMIFYLPR